MIDETRVRRLREAHEEYTRTVREVRERATRAAAAEVGRATAEVRARLRDEVTATLAESDAGRSDVARVLGVSPSTVAWWLRESS